ncbi:adenosine deaminase, putative [Plasmodium malariae]|uniref:Adenosine deaminase n=2 Tax=Plasmodium (Plasmodium) TaxID=418103 RepID=A0A1A8WI94_PLAMA|nr:adenosine deaminase, putative [Plasmodium malariae]SBS92643.1 adenosine deaminase [Plasmodium malariae]SCN45113.1 adenosine deaminase, putative [Plasmodium malariae]
MNALNEPINFLKKDEIKNIDLSSMSKKERYRIWKRIPKCELHCHLDLCFSSDFFLNCVRKYNLQPNLSDEEVIDYYLFSKGGKSLEEFVEKAIRVADIFQDYEVIADLAKHAVFNKYKEGVVLMEFRYAPTFIAFKHKLDIELVHEAIVKGIKEVVELLDHNIHVALICIGDTGHEATNIKLCADFCLKHKDDFVGFDHGGYEIDLKQYSEIFNYVRESGIPLTVHAGEDINLPNLNTLYSAIEILKVERIGHGIRVVESKELIKLVKEKNILLEVCPISNVLLKNAKSMDTHPIRKLYDAGVKVSVNSDDPGMFLTNINDDYEELYTHLNFTLEEFMQMNEWALEKSFVDDSVKSNVKELYF